MQKNPIKDKDLGVSVHNWDGDKFRDLRHKAGEDYVARCKKRKKDKSVIAPSFKVGDKVVAYQRWGQRYIFAEIVDFSMATNSEIFYYGIVLRITDDKMKDSIGRLCHFCETRTHWVGSDFAVTTFKETDIKWL